MREVTTRKRERGGTDYILKAHIACMHVTCSARDENRPLGVMLGIKVRIEMNVDPKMRTRNTGHQPWLVRIGRKAAHDALLAFTEL